MPMTDIEQKLLRRIADLKADREQYNEWAREIKINIDAMREEIERLREALRPFARMADEVDAWATGVGQFTGRFDANDLRRARELLAEESPLSSAIRPEGS